MILERSINAKRNSIWGLISRLITTAFPFFVRTVLIQEMGVEYLGLSGLFTSILTVLNITELGFGTSIVYSMYKPLAEGDSEKLCALLNYYKKIYRIIGCIILVVGLLCTPFLRYFIKGDLPNDVNLYILYFLYLINTVLSYFLFAYKNSILTIYQRDDVKSKTMLLLSILMYGGQIIAIFATHSYYCYLVVLLIYTAFNNILPAMYVKKYYPQYVCRGDISNNMRTDIKQKVTGMMITKVSAMGRNAFDSIIISAFFGLTTVAVYNNYYYIINAITSMLLVITTAIAAGVGNSVAADSREKNLKDMYIINFWFMWIASWCTSCLACLYQPFMRIWVGEDLMFPTYIMILFCTYFWAQKLGDIQAQYFDAAGLWWHRKIYSVVEAVMNIVLNIVLGYFFGVAGVVIATILTIVFINFLGSSRIVFKHYFKTGVKKYILIQLCFSCVAMLMALLSYAACSLIYVNTSELSGQIVDLLLRAAVCFVIPNVVFIAAFFPTKLFKEALPWLKIRLQRK